MFLDTQFNTKTAGKIYEFSNTNRLIK